LFADDDGIIWVGTLGLGLDRFDPIKNVFTHYRHQEDNTASLINDTVTAITKDREGNLWIGTHGGLERLDIKTGKFTHYKHNDRDSTSLSNNTVRIVYVDREDEVWIGTCDPFYNDAGLVTKEGGLNRLNKKTNRFIRYIHNDADSLSLVDNRVRAICEDSRGTFWAGTAGDGLHALDRATGKFKRYPYDVSNPDKLSRPPLGKTLSFVDDHITFIKEDSARFLWIGTMMGGVTKYDPKTQKVSCYGVGKDISTGFGDNSGWFAYSSRDGSFWISTWEASLYQIDPFKKSFPYNKIGAKVEGIYKESKGGAWICTPGTFTNMDASNNIIKKYYINKDHSDVAEIYNFYRDRNGSFWILTNQSLISFDAQTEKFRRYVHDNADKKSLSNNSVYAIVEDHNMDLWVGTLEGLNKLDRETGEFIHYSDTTKNSNTVNSNFITTIFEDRKNRLWVGTADGINLFDGRTGKFKNHLKGIKIRSILEDTESSLWVGGSDGLFRLRASLDSFVSFPDPGSGLRFKNVVGISEDDQKKLWLYTSSGIVSINRQRDNSNSFDLGLNNIVYIDHVLNGYNGEVFLSDAMGYYDVIPGEISGNFISPPGSF
jgi:ligand-binding sensor domain-containing protein